jgi:hypothetical protein
MTKARELRVGDILNLNVGGEVVEVSAVADGKRIKVKLLLEDQATGLEFTDSSCTIEFLCPPGRPCSVSGNTRDDDDDVDDPEVGPDPTGGDSLVLVDAE